MTAETEFRSGFVCLVGRPNTGKSTLTNAMVGTKIAITSMRPQTTRHTIRGIVHRKDFQIVLVDTPGLHRPRTLLGKRLNDLVRDTYAEVDVIGLCIPADEAIGPGTGGSSSRSERSPQDHPGGHRHQNRQGAQGQGGRSAGRGERAGRAISRNRAGVRGFRRAGRRIDRCAGRGVACGPGLLPRRRADRRARRGPDGRAHPRGSPGGCATNCRTLWLW